MRFGQACENIHGDEIFRTVIYGGFQAKVVLYAIVSLAINVVDVCQSKLIYLIFNDGS